MVITSDRTINRRLIFLDFVHVCGHHRREPPQTAAAACSSGAQKRASGRQTTGSTAPDPEASSHVRHGGGSGAAVGVYARLPGLLGTVPRVLKAALW